MIPKPAKHSIMLHLDGRVELRDYSAKDEKGTHLVIISDGLYRIHRFKVNRMVWGDYYVVVFTEEPE